MLNDLKIQILKFIKNYLASAVIKSFIKGILTKAVGGPFAFIIMFAVRKGLKWGVIATTHLENAVETHKEVTKEKEEYDKVVNDPKSTADDIKNSGPGFLG